MVEKAMVQYYRGDKIQIVGVSMQAFLLRLHDYGTRTLGRLLLFDELNPVGTWVTLELPWRGNEQNVSCIPLGNYGVIPWESPKHGKCLKIMNVPGRDDILIHVLNWPHQTLGCIGVGNDFKDLDKDRILDISASTKALKELLKKAPNGFELTITE